MNEYRIKEQFDLFTIEVKVNITVGIPGFMSRRTTWYPVDIFGGAHNINPRVGNASLNQAYRDINKAKSQIKAFSEKPKYHY